MDAPWKNGKGGTSLCSKQNRPACGVSHGITVSAVSLLVLLFSFFSRAHSVSLSLPIAIANSKDLFKSILNLKKGQMLQ